MQDNADSADDANKQRKPALAGFEALGLSVALLDAVHSLGHSKPTPIQAEAVGPALDGKNLIAVAQTGSGKTLAYAASALSQLERDASARVLVLSPTRETAEQVFAVFQSLNKQLQFSLALAVTGQSLADQIKVLKKNPRLIVATPGRMQEHLQGNKLLLKGLSLLILDEADRILDMGFSAQLKFLHSTLRGQWQTLLFAASFGPWAEASAKLLLEGQSEPLILRSEHSETVVSTLQQSVYFLNISQKNHRLLDELRGQPSGILIFVESQENCVAVGRYLAHHGFVSEFVHGNMNPGHRGRILREFREKKIAVLVTTDLLARGLDIPHVDLVINYDLPYKSEDFLHRIGRTARAGRPGSALTFIAPNDGRTYRKIRGYLTGAREQTLATGFEFIER